MNKVLLVAVPLCLGGLLGMPQRALAGILVPGLDIASTTAEESRPAIDGDTVVWLEGDPDHGFTIHTRELGGPERAIAPAASPNGAPDISGGVVVWSDDRDGGSHVYGYDLATDTEFRIATGLGMQWGPSISGDTVVWSDDRDAVSGVDIYAADISDRAAPEEFAVCTAPGLQTDPAVSGNIVVWTDARNEAGGQPPADGTDIYAADITDHAAPQESAVCTAPGSQDEPAVDGVTVVWEDLRTPGPGQSADYDVYGADISDRATPVEFPVCTGASDSRLPAVSDGLAVWQDDRNRAEGGRPNGDIYGYDIAKNLEFPITLAPTDDRGADITGTRVVWEARSFVGISAQHGTGYTLDGRGALISGWQASVRFAGGRAWTRQRLATVTAQATSWGGPTTDLRTMLSGGAWSDWTSAVPPTRMVDLGPADGRKLLSVQFRDAAGGLSPGVNATITLDRRGPVVLTEAATARHDAAVTLRYRASDSLSRKAMITVAVWTGYEPHQTRLVRRFASLWRPTDRWLGRTFVCALPPGAYHFTVEARDLAGNPASRPGYNKLTVR